MQQGQDSGAAQGSAYAPQTYGSGYPTTYQQGYGVAPYGGYGGYGAPRSGTKTFFIAGLLSLIPFVGVGMAAIYYFTKQQPDAFDGGKAAGASFVAGIASLVVAVIIVAVAVVVIVGLGQASR